VQARIAAFCRMFDLEAPARQVYRRSIHLTGALLGWCNMVGACLEWILFGDARCLVTTNREQNARSSWGQHRCWRCSARARNGSRWTV
jgi:hypothetical protein